MKLDLKVYRRHGRIAPFINGQNLWDLPPKVWTEEVQSALLIAYRAGAEHMRNEIMRSEVPETFNVYWPKKKLLWREV